MLFLHHREMTWLVRCMLPRLRLKKSNASMHSLEVALVFCEWGLLFSDFPHRYWLRHCLMCAYTYGTMRENEARSPWSQDTNVSIDAFFGPEVACQAHVCHLAVLKCHLKDKSHQSVVVDMNSVHCSSAANNTALCDSHCESANMRCTTQAKLSKWKQ